jgi:toxin ParE1/3/4
MIYEVKVSKRAEEDLKSIFQYIAFKLHAPQNAQGQLERLEKSIISLEQMPERFRKYGKEPWQARGLRAMAVDHYIVFYILDSEKQAVTVMRVMYSSRDVDKQLEK